VTLKVRKVQLPILIEKTLRTGHGLILYIDEVVRNLGIEDLQIMWGHHPTLGASFIDQDCHIDSPAASGDSLPAERFSCQRLAPG
jgi:hypothetical protein